MERRGATYHSCRRPDIFSSRFGYTHWACKSSNYRRILYSSLKGGCTSRKQRSMDRRSVAEYYHLGMDRRRHLALMVDRLGDPRDTSFL